MEHGELRMESNFVCSVTTARRKVRFSYSYSVDYVLTHTLLFVLWYAVFNTI